MIDSGAGGKFIDQNYAKKFDIQKLDAPIRVYNVDGTENKKGTIKFFVNLTFRTKEKQFTERLFVSGLGKQKIILGLPWLTEHNPIIDWKTGEMKWEDVPERPKRYFRRKEDIEQDKNQSMNPIADDEEETSVLISLLRPEDDEIWINAKTNKAMELAIEENKKKADIPTEQMVPEEYHDYLDVFDEEKANRYPESRSWDHKIETKEGFEPKSFPNYNLTPAEQVELDKFLKENLEKEYIRPSQSPMASPFFFVSKKDGKLRPCQDYRYLNDGTIKNAYPLPLISEIMDKLDGAKYFTKLDVRWGYNNIRIKKGHEWKAAFKTNRGLFEPTVMFFGMCNSPATFQAMMDSIFADMIEGCVVIVYMDDILIFAKTQEDLERHTKMVLQRLREHDLYLKPKKCEFNKKKIEYLGMIIEEGRISMDPVKLAGIRDWPIPTTVKQV